MARTTTKLEPCVGMPGGRGASELGSCSSYDLTVLVKQMTNSHSEIVFIPYEEAYEAGFEDMPCRAPDISKIQRLMGYRPVLDLPDMLERVMAYEQERRSEGAIGVGASIAWAAWFMSRCHPGAMWWPA